MKLIRFFTLAGLLVVLAFGCGYHLEGGGDINEGVTLVAVDVFENKSSEARAGMSFTNQLIQEIQTKTDTAVVDIDKATRKITGTVNAVTFSALSRVSTETVVERKVTALVDVQLTGPDGEILWSVKNLSSTESYSVDAGSVDDEANKQVALEKIALRSAERVVSMMMSNF
jgi:outer membrane lipopolysaccharide assembly protein LptE/RlpB